MNLQTWDDFRLDTNHKKTMQTNDTLVARERPAHWYYPDGRSCHTLPKKDGSGEKNTTLADARKLGLFPSVTSILSIKSKPGLDAWKLEQAILSALTLPRGTEETEDAFAKRVAVDMENQAAKAAEWGTKIHAECEEMHRMGIMIRRDDTFPFVEEYEQWFNENVLRVINVETTVVNPLVGYAGRLDLVAKLKDGTSAVIDLKTQKVKKEPVFYREWGMQLAAYQQALYEQGGDFDELYLISVVIDSAKPGRPAIKRWEDEMRYWAAFKHCAELWKFDRDYYPAG